MTLFRCQVYLAGQGLLIGDTIFTTLRWISTFHMTDTHTQKHNRHMSPRPYGLTSLSKKTERSNHLQMLEQRHQLLLSNYFKTPIVGLAGNPTRASCMM